MENQSLNSGAKILKGGKMGFKNKKNAIRFALHYGSSSKDWYKKYNVHDTSSYS